MSISIHRDTDLRTCGARTIVVNQSSVFANNLLVSVMGDPNTHSGGELHASVNPSQIFIENQEMVVVGSTANPDRKCPVPGGPHCNPVSVTGSPDVLACFIQDDNVVEINVPSNAGSVPTAPSASNIAQIQNTQSFNSAPGTDITADQNETKSTVPQELTADDQQEVLDMEQDSNTMRCEDPRLVFRSGTSEANLIKKTLCDILISLADYFGKTLTITSGYRPPAYNASVGGSSNSFHLRGEAADVSMVGWNQSEREQFITEAVKRGARGIGVYGSFTHIDIRGTQTTWQHRSTPSWAKTHLSSLGFDTSRMV